MPAKRRRADADEASRSTTLKRARHTASPDLLSPLSDELLVRILSLLPLPDLLNVSPLSDRFYHLSGDSQIWKRLYYSRFVLPRALRIPGFRDGSAREGKLHYSARKAIWADGRRGGWVDMRNREDKNSRDWKRQYKLRHNWSRGKCAVEELHVGQDTALSDMESSQKMLVKVSEGLAVTADAATGLRAWDLKTKQLQAQIGLDELDSSAIPSCIAIDDHDVQEKTLNIAIGFTDGSFGIWRLDTKERRIMRRYRHEKSSNGKLAGIAFSYPYLLTATKSVLISVYTFEGSPSEAESETARESESEIAQELEGQTEDERRYGHSRPRIRAEKSKPGTTLQVPYLLTSLKSHTSRAPLALSLRKTSGSTVASIAYTFSTLQGWSLGIQDLHLRAPASRVGKSTPEITTTRLAYTLPVKTASTHIPSPPTSPARYMGSSTTSTTSRDDVVDGPISLCYTHPYLLATLPDNTLILHLCTSNASSLSISPGIRLWGHTSGISDAEITARGKAVSVSCRGEEIRVWELEGRANGSSIEVRPTVKPVEDEGDEEEAAVRDGPAAMRWNERRNWVGFDDEMVIVLKESREGKESLMVYDFT
ncbi:Uu.00g110660.m01.CDS01 [Anthostomella pinea]|uniref:Uu.00g110660.m01.CDS01 n=1 Tax=Anthostomella pinea TaxID=933095 RepID=A0AAI8YDV8_9PEZI|nr:Uu.00g110660.m01.CDS01 [Anthostomella pinea]